MAKRKTSILDDVNNLFIVMPWWFGPIVVLAVYGLLEYLVPQLIPKMFPASDNSTAAAMNKTFLQLFKSIAPMLAPWAAGLVLMVWLVSLMQKWKRRQLLNKAGDLDKVRALSWQEFELLVGEYYRRQGFMVEEQGGASPDGGVDVVLRKSGLTTLVQCKHWKASKVGVKPIRELLGVMTHQNAYSGILVTSGQFTAEASDFAGENQIELVDGDILIKMFQSVQTSKQNPTPAAPLSPQQSTIGTAKTINTPACPKCGSPMIQRTARKGTNAGSTFYGCQRYPACKGILNIEK